MIGCRVTTLKKMEMIQKAATNASFCISGMVATAIVRVAAPSAAIDTIARHADQVTALARTVADSGLPQPPGWVEGVPVVGANIMWASGFRNRCWNPFTTLLMDPRP